MDWTAAFSPLFTIIFQLFLFDDRLENIGSICTRVGPLSGDQEATQIFIIYMHDIVLEISFLDLNDCPNLSPSNWKLLQKSVNI